MTYPEDQEVEYIRSMIRRDKRFAVQVFRRIWDAQQPIEKFTGEYAGSDGGRGFKANETRYWNDFYDRFEDTGRLTSDEIGVLQKGMVQYARQYYRLTRERAIEAKERIGA